MVNVHMLMYIHLLVFFTGQPANTDENQNNIQDSPEMDGIYFAVWRLIRSPLSKPCKIFCNGYNAVLQIFFRSRGHACSTFHQHEA